LHNIQEALGKGCLKEHFFFCARMKKAKGHGMQGLTGQKIETILNELFVLGESGSPEDPIPPLFRVG